MLGAGFDHNLTAKENIFFNGALRAIPRKKIQEKYDEIVDFADAMHFYLTFVKPYCLRAYIFYLCSMMRSGKAKVYGSIAPLIELGAGFDHNLTAKENIFFNLCL